MGATLPAEPGAAAERLTSIGLALAGLCVALTYLPLPLGWLILGSLDLKAGWIQRWLWAATIVGAVIGPFMALKVMLRARGTVMLAGALLFVLTTIPWIAYLLR